MKEFKVGQAVVVNNGDEKYQAIIGIVIHSSMYGVDVMFEGTKFDTCCKRFKEQELDLAHSYGTKVKMAYEHEIITGIITGRDIMFSHNNEGDDNRIFYNVTDKVNGKEYEMVDSIYIDLI